MNARAVIFTDLDGTLLDHDSYDFGPAAATLTRTRQAGIPVCVCSSKTRSEIVFHRRRMGLRDPFIVENGGAVYIPRGYFSDYLERQAAETEDANGYDVEELGARYAVLVEALQDIRARLRLPLRGFHEMTAEELSSIADLPIDQARMALEREYDEPFVFEGADDDFPSAAAAMTALLSPRGLRMVRGGRFHHVLGGSDKGRAVRLLIDRFARDRGNPVSVAIGDSANDIPMLLEAGIAILVQRPSGEFDADVRRHVPAVRLAEGIGPHGWHAAIAALLDEWGL